MDFKPDAQIDQGSVSRGGGGGRGGGGIAVGGVGGLVLVLIAVFLGVNPGDLLGSGGAQDAQPQASSTVQCKTGADVQKNPDCRWDAYMSSLNQYWSQAAGQNFTKPKLQIFSGSVTTACGQASSQVGPFYCPADKVIYIDTDFAAKLLNQLGAKGGPAAEAYIVGHEYGHHIENLQGILTKANQDRSTGPKSSGVRVELMADCYAGSWFKWASENPDDIIENVTSDDLVRVVDAARAVGDDTIQSQNSGGVNPDGWTHGSSAMRQYWVKKGFDTGDPNQCDTFSTDDLGS